MDPAAWTIITPEFKRAIVHAVIQIAMRLDFVSSTDVARNRFALSEGGGLTASLVCQQVENARLDGGSPETE